MFFTLFGYWVQGGGAEVSQGIGTQPANANFFLMLRTTQNDHLGYVRGTNVKRAGGRGMPHRVLLFFW